MYKIDDEVYTRCFYKNQIIWAEARCSYFLPISGSDVLNSVLNWFKAEAVLHGVRYKS